MLLLQTVPGYVYFMDCLSTGRVARFWNLSATISPKKQIWPIRGGADVKREDKMRTERTRRAILMLFLAGWMAFCAVQAAASGVAVTAAPRQAQGSQGESETQASQEEVSGEEGQGEAPAEDAQDGAVAQDQQASGGGWDSGSSVVQNRTSSEQQTIGEAEKKLQSALHTEVANPDLSIEAALGYGGTVIYAKPVPVEVTLKNSGADLTGSVCVNLYRTSSSYDRVEYPLYLPAGSEKRIRFYVTLTMKQDVFTVEYCAGVKTIASINVSPSKAISPDTCLVGALSSSPGALSYLNIDAKNDRLLRGEYFQAVPLDVDSFPDTADALGAFGMLAVDGVDLTALNDAQKAAFDAWLKAGGVAIVGGGAHAAADYPFFEPYTGVSAGELYQAADITPVLLAALGETGDPLGQGVLLSRLAPGAGSIAQTAEGGLVNLSKPGGGAVFLSAFELGARPLTDWAGIGTLWQRMMIKWAPDAYTGLFSGSGDWNGNSDFRVSQVLGELPVKNATAPKALIAWLLGGFVAVSGILMYLLLKKLDRRGLLWFTMPACALIASFLVYSIGKTSDAAKPIATSYTWAILDAGGQSSMTTGVGAATPSRKAVRLSAGSGITLVPAERNDFEDNYYDNSTFLKTPSKLRYLRTLGTENSVTLPAQAAWTLNSMTATDNRAFEGGIPAAIWMEDDGLHGHVKNGTPYPLTDCAVITSAGYADVGDLAPGQQADFQLLKLTDQEADQLKAAQGGDYYDFAPEGRIIGTSPDGTAGYVDVSVIFNGAVIKESRILDRAKRSEALNQMASLARAERSARQDLIGMCMDKWAYNSGWGSGDSFFRFYGFSDQLGAGRVTLDGGATARAAPMAVVGAEIAYQPVGPTGVAFYPLGVIPAHVASAETGAPILGEEAEKDKSYRITANPVFGFLIPGADKLENMALTLRSRFYDQPAATQLYNAQTGAWDEMSTAFLSLKGAKLSPYLGADGSLYVRYSPGPKSDGYQEILPPAISVAGRVQK